jgi:dienelactone hydrolase
MNTAAFAAILMIGATAGCRAAEEQGLRDAYRRELESRRARTDLKSETLKSETREGKTIERVAFWSEKGERVIAVVIRLEAPADRAAKRERLPAVIVQHWLGGSKEEFAVQALLWQFATRGYLAAAIDGRHRGERAGTRDGGGRTQGSPLQAAMIETLKTGKGRPWLLDTVYDVLRTVDYLETRDDVDRKRIGMTGISEGGFVTWLAAVADPRIKVAAPMIGVTRFQDLTSNLSGSAGQSRVNLMRPVLEAFAKQEGATTIDSALMRKAWDRLLPGFLGRFEADRLVPLIAPRPLLILAHEKDELIPLAGAEAVYAAAQKRYRALNAEEKLQFRIAPGLTHTGQDMAEIAALFGWFDRWLKAEGGGTAGGRG